jgi:hypothetical protein
MVNALADLLYVAASVLFFGVLVLFVEACGKL